MMARSTRHSEQNDWRVHFRAASSIYFLVPNFEKDAYASVYWSCQVLYISILKHGNNLRSNLVEPRLFHHRLGVRVWESFSV
jgi:hypothetical protein